VGVEKHQSFAPVKKGAAILFLPEKIPTQIDIKKVETLSFNWSEKMMRNQKLENDDFDDCNGNIK